MVLGKNQTPCVLHLNKRHGKSISFVLNVRNNNDYPFSNNMYLIVTMKEPGKKPTIKVDTLEYLMAKSRWNFIR